MSAADLLTRIRETCAGADELGESIESGEPAPPAPGLRARIGSFAKGRLYRLLWWYSSQLRTIAALIKRISREHSELAAHLLAKSEQQNSQQTALRDEVNALSSAFNAWKVHVNEVLDQQNTETTSRLSELQAAIERLSTELNERMDAAHLHAETLARNVSTAAAADIATSLQHIRTEAALREELATRVSQLGDFTHHTRATLSIQERRLALFFEDLRKQVQPIAPQHILDMANVAAEHRYDSAYVEFENTFRGSREEIKARQAVYLPTLQNHGIGTPEMGVLDLGCGRGEWVELLADHGLSIHGVDNNDYAIEWCKALGLNVTHADALTHLKNAPDASKGAITAFHMVEHMPFDVVMTLVDEALRVLKPGGVLILETPNPANLLVSTHTFYLDPTHRKPIPSGMLRFYVEARGFCDVVLKELHPYPEVMHLPADPWGIGSRFNQHFYGAQDYAVIGKKPDVSNVSRTGIAPVQAR